MKPCVFFDRDGIANVCPGPGRYVETEDDFHIIPAFVDALRVVAHRGYEAVIVTNQRGVALGRVTDKTLNAMHAKLELHLSGHSLGVLGIYACTANDSAHPFRKPNPGMLLHAADVHHLDLTRSWMVGDHERDILAGQRAGCRTIYVGAEPLDGATHCVRVMDELPALLEKVL